VVVGRNPYIVRSRDMVVAAWLLYGRAAVSIDAVAAMRRTEDTIRRLCGTLLATGDEEEQAMIVVELQAVLHEHVQRVRSHLALSPFVEERRVRDQPIE
jgi:hypothetical protein